MLKVATVLPYLTPESAPPQPAAITGAKTTTKSNLYEKRICEIL